MSKEKYLIQKKELLKILSDWDPYDLVDQDSTPDEYAEEAALILTSLQSAKSITEIKAIVVKVFLEQFGDKKIETDEVAKKILEIL